MSCVRPALGRTSLGSAGEFGRDLGWARNQTERSRIFLWAAALLGPQRSQQTKSILEHITFCLCTTRRIQYNFYSI